MLQIVIAACEKALEQLETNRMPAAPGLVADLERIVRRARNEVDRRSASPLWHAQVRPRRVRRD